MPYETFALHSDKPVEHVFPDGFSAYWVRAISSVSTTVTVTLRYE